MASAMTNGALPLVNHPATSEDAKFRALLADSIKRSAQSREQIAERMSSFLGKQITVNQLNQWTALSHEAWRMPAAYVRAFCEATGDNRLQRFILGTRLSSLLALGEVIAQNIPALLSRQDSKKLSASRAEGPQNDLF